MPESLPAALQEHRDLLWGVCYRMLGCPADADDALQVLWIELDASGRVSALHVQTAHSKLTGVAFERLSRRPSSTQLMQAAWDALRFPQPAAWTRSAATAGGGALLHAIRTRGRSGLHWLLGA